MTLERSRADHLKAERDRERYFAAELVDALRGKHPHARVMPVAYEGEDITWDLHTAGERPSFRVLGRGRMSAWEFGEPTLVLSPRYLEPGTLAAFHVLLSEPRYEVARRLLKIRGLACGKEHFWTSRKPIHLQDPDRHCPMCQLLAGSQRVFTWRDDGWNRNVQHISKEQAEIACTLLRAGRIIKLDGDKNRSLN